MTEDYISVKNKDVTRLWKRYHLLFYKFWHKMPKFQRKVYYENDVEVYLQEMWLFMHDIVRWSTNMKPTNWCYYMIYQHLSTMIKARSTIRNKFIPKSLDNTFNEDGKTKYIDTVKSQTDTEDECIYKDFVSHLNDDEQRYVLGKIRHGGHSFRFVKDGNNSVYKTVKSVKEKLTNYYGDGRNIMRRTYRKPVVELTYSKISDKEISYEDYLKLYSSCGGTKYTMVRNSPFVINIEGHYFYLDSLLEAAQPKDRSLIERYIRNIKLDLLPPSVIFKWRRDYNSRTIV